MSQLCISSSKNYLRKNSNLLLQQCKHHSDTAAKRGFLLTTTKTNSSSSLLCWRSFSSVSQQQKGNKSEKKGIDEKSVQDDILSMDVDELNLSPWRNLLIHPARALWRTSSTTLTRKGIMKLEAEQRDKTKKQKRRHTIKESNSQHHYSVEEKIYLQYRDILKKSNRTKNQLHRTHMKMISHQEKLRESRLIGRKEAERQKHNLLSNDTVIIDGRRKRTTRSLKIAPDSLQATQLRKSQETLLANENFGYNPEHTCVYMKHRLFPNYYIIERVLKELKSLMMSTNKKSSLQASSSSEEKNPPIIRKVIDFGVGCGSASAAALQVFGSGRAGEQQTNNNNHSSTSDAANKHKTAQEQQIERLRQFIVRKNNLNINDNEDKEHNFMEEGSIEWIHGIDASKSMREVSEKIINAIINKGSSNNQSKSPFSSSSSFRFTSGESLTSSSSSSIQNSTSTSPTTSTGLGTFDLALFCYTAQELPSTSAVLSSAAILWEKLAPNGYFVMVEPGTPDGFHSVRAVREMLLDCCPPSQSQQKAHSPYFNFGGFENDENVSAATTTAENHVAVEEAHVIAPCTHNSICPLNKFSPIASGNQESDDDDTVESIDDTEDEFNKKELFQDDDDDDIETDWDSGDIRDMMENEEFAIQEMSKELDLLYGDNEKAFDLLRDLQNDELESQDFDSDDDEDENEEDKDNGLNENQDSTTNTTSKKNKFSLVETTDIFSNGFCSFVHALPATQLNNNRGKVGRKKGEKFSFIILQKRLVPMNSNTQPQTNSYQENKQNMEYDGNTVEESSDNNNNTTTYSSSFSTSNHDINDENIVDMLAKNIHLGMKYNKGVMEYEKLKRKKNVRLNRRDTIHEHDEEEIAFKMKEKEVKEASDSHVNFFTEIMALEKKKSSNDSSSSMEESNISNKTKKDELGLELVSKARRRSTYYSLNNDDIISTGTSQQEQSNEQGKKKPFYYEQVQPDQNYPWGRLIRSPLKMKGHVMVDYCTGGISQPQLNNDDDDSSSMNDDEVTSTHQESTTDHYQQQRELRTHGRIVRHKVTRAKSDNLSPGLYSAARKARWGGFWPDLSGYEQLMQSDKSASSSSNSDENVKNKS